ncbi:hypothetical protein FJZ19_02270 [Candidatus Pacearchaeota archaeon]|nr:hypothetical protein [Candidatus Pacearchaeota archaeon]
MTDLETQTKLERVKERIADSENPVELVNNMYGCHPETPARLSAAKSRMADWQNPVEVVNNIYGCHPKDNRIGYFQRVFSLT